MDLQVFQASCLLNSINNPNNIKKVLNGVCELHNQQWGVKNTPITQ